MPQQESQNSPLLTVIITTGSGYESIRTTIEHLKRQTVSGGLEVIIIAPSVKWAEDIGTELGVFNRYSTMEADLDEGLYDAWVTAIQRANAPIVALGENHAFPEPSWAEALIEAHKGPWAVVGCVFKNANPDTVNSWAQLYMTYGQFTEPASSGEVRDLPGHNSSYKRPLLLDYGKSLGTMLIRTNMLHMDLRSRGYALYLQSEARIDHINVSRTPSVFLDLFYNGWLYTAALADYRKMAPSARLKMIILEPAIILKHFLGTLGSIRRAGKGKELLPSALPIITAGLTFHLLGKIWGYIAGYGSAQKRINSYEFDRYKHITQKDIEHISKLP